MSGTMDGVDEDPKISPMTDEEAELFRYLRFGQLPERVDPADMVGSVDTRHLQPDDPELQERQNWNGLG